MYWRAAVLDDFAADRWLQGGPRAGDSLEPAASRVRSNLVRQEVTVRALADTRLVGGSVPVSFSAGDAPLVRPEPGFAYLPSGLTRGFRYTVWSYAPRPTPARLGASAPIYPAALTRPAGFLDVWPGVTAPPFGAAGRAARLNAVLDAHPDIARYIPLEQDAIAVAGKARTPYAAAIDLESWFRSRGGFRYTDHPSVFGPAPLVGFVAETRAGYCQYFAGAMALMLRYLGVPARVAVGFSSGSYDAKTGVWTVTDHDAHAWVEAWFRGYGWLPFDPTPSAGRPELGAAERAVLVGVAGLRSPERRRHAGRTGRERRRAGGAPARRDGPEPGGGGGLLGGGSSSASTSQHTSLLTLLLLVVAAAVALIVLDEARDAACPLPDARPAPRRRRLPPGAGGLPPRPAHRGGPKRHPARARRARPPRARRRPGSVRRRGDRRPVRPARGRADRRPANARRELRSLVRRVRARLGARDRLRGLLSLRSLGFAPSRAT